MPSFTNSQIITLCMHRHKEGKKIGLFVGMSVRKKFQHTAITRLIKKLEL